MKKRYIICLFSMVFVFSSVYYISYRYSLDHFRAKEATEGETKEMQYVAAEANKEIIVKEGMQYIHEIYDLDTNNIAEETGKIPIAMLGLNREALIRYLDELSVQTEKEDSTFIGYDLMSFSEDRLVIRKTIDTDRVKKGYTLTERDGKLAVYDNATGEMYLETEIEISKLPKEEQEKIRAGIETESIDEVYNYLESYTS